MNKISTALPPRRPVDDSVTLVADIVDVGAAAAPLHPPAAMAAEICLVEQREVVRPGLLLADGSVVVLGWNQLRPLRDVLDQFLTIAPKHLREPA